MRISPNPPGVLSLRRYWTAVCIVAFIFLVMFGIAEALEIPLLIDPSAWMDSRGTLAAGVGVLLLVADIWLPVPASIVMTANGALFGVVPGALLSLTGSVSA